MGSSELGRWRTEAHVQENFSEPASWRKAHSWTSAILFLQEEEEFNSKCIDFFAYYLSLKWVDRIVGHWWFLFALGCRGIPPSHNFLMSRLLPFATVNWQLFSSHNYFLFSTGKDPLQLWCYKVPPRALYWLPSVRLSWICYFWSSGDTTTQSNW